MAEPDTIPSYLKNSPKYEYWETEDAKGKTIESTRLIRDEIESSVKQLVV